MALGKQLIGQYVVVRTQAAGVHMGTLVERAGRNVELMHARRLWRWRGANSLHEIATKGVDVTSHTRISEQVDRIVLSDAIEVLVSTGVAKEKLDRSVWFS